MFLVRLLEACCLEKSVCFWLEGCVYIYFQVLLGVFGGVLVLEMRGVFMFDGIENCNGIE